VVAVGNPDDAASRFATICKPGSGWHVETIRAFDTQVYTGEKAAGLPREWPVPRGLLDAAVMPALLWAGRRRRILPLGVPVECGFR
jgi:hypothetical protein